MGYHSERYTFTLMTDAHAGEKETIDTALSEQFLRDVQVLADSYNTERGRDMVFLGWDRVTPALDGRCAEHGKVLPHFRCQESEAWLDARGYK